MKRGCLTTLVVLLLSGGLLVAGYWYKYPNYTCRYRLTVNIELDGNASFASITSHISYGSQSLKTQPVPSRYSWTISPAFLVQPPTSPEPPLRSPAIHS